MDRGWKGGGGEEVAWVRLGEGLSGSLSLAIRVWFPRPILSPKGPVQLSPPCVIACIQAMKVSEHCSGVSEGFSSRAVMRR